MTPKQVASQVQAQAIKINDSEPPSYRTVLRVIDSYSRALIGINVGFDAPSSQVVALALRHAILPKVYDSSIVGGWLLYSLSAIFWEDGGMAKVLLAGKLDNKDLDRSHKVNF